LSEATSRGRYDQDAGEEKPASYPNAKTRV